MKRAITPKSRDEMLRSFPIEDAKAPGWYFRTEEVSNCVWKVEGEDAYGRSVSRTGHPNPDVILQECVLDALWIVKQTGKPVPSE
jgi:hypothetical protein